MSDSLIQGLTNDGADLYENELDKYQKMYAVPYFIWANYDVKRNADEIYRNNDGMTITSSIYLGASIERYAGIKMSSYSKFLLNMRENIPAINKYGYMDKLGVWHSFGDENRTDDEIPDIIHDYSILEYANMFDSGKYGELLR